MRENYSCKLKKKYLPDCKKFYIQQNETQFNKKQKFSFLGQQSSKVLNLGARWLSKIEYTLDSLVTAKYT